MIRINLLPHPLRRRRLVLRREVVVVAVMLLGWAMVMSVGYMWIDAKHAQVAQLRADKLAVEEATKQASAHRQHASLATRQKVLRVRREALQELRAERHSPLVRLQELAALFGAAGEEPPLRLLEIRSEAPQAWRVVGQARDAVVLGELVRRLQASERFGLTYGPEYTRTGDDRLRFHVDVTLHAWD